MLSQSGKAIHAATLCDGTVCSSIAEAVKDADYIFSIVGYPKDVEEVMLSGVSLIRQRKMF